MSKILLHISSKQWETAPVQIAENGEEVRLLSFTEQEFFIENENDKVLIQVGFGYIAVDWIEFQKVLNDYFGER